MPQQPAPQILSANAPVLLLPNLIDPGMCQDLIALWNEGEHDEGKVVSVVGDEEIARIHTKVKKRRDHRIMDMDLHKILQWTIGRRIAPELEKVFHFKGFRFDRFAVVCYDADRGDYFRVHRDNLAPTTADRAFALTLNLNVEKYEGGELVFPEYGPHKYRPTSGGGILFSCSLMHEALPVTRGRRFALLSFLRTLDNHG
jgi:Rps23 Pro-64 3,4-dihydroxylase Tpa1-like proline 4-hydroxylase